MRHVPFYICQEAEEIGLWINVDLFRSKGIII